MDTRVDLVVELKKHRETPARERLIKYAARGDYHCFVSSVAAPKMHLVEALEHAAMVTKDPSYKLLAIRVMNGEFDDDVPGRKPR